MNVIHVKAECHISVTLLNVLYLYVFVKTNTFEQPKCTYKDMYVYLNQNMFQFRQMITITSSCRIKPRKVNAWVIGHFVASVLDPITPSVRY